MVILPGGQYAEKGLVVNLPQDVSNVISQISGLENICVVQFEMGLPVGSTNGYLIDPIKVKDAATWLTQHNLLYHDTNIFIPNVATTSSQLQHNFHERTSTQDCINSLEEVTFAPVDYTLQSDSQTSSGNNHIQTILYLQTLILQFSTYEIPYGEENSFPWLFPVGKFGYTFPRPKKLQT